jgi:Tfp pilus assembly protein PilX
MCSRRRLADQSGSTLVMIIGVVAVLAVLAATLVMVTANTQGATAANRKEVTAFNVAEAGLNSAVAGVGSSWPSTSGSTFSETALTAAFTSAYPSSDYPDANTRPTADITAYDNLTPINTSVHWDSNGDGIMWVQSRGAFSSKAATVRTQVRRDVTETSAIFPGVAVYSGADVTLPGSSNIYGPVDSSGDPVSALYALGNITQAWTPDLATVDVLHNGTRTWRNTTYAATGGVPSLDTVVPSSMVASLTSASQLATSTGTVISQSSAGFSWPYGVTYTSPVVVNGDLHIGSEGTYTFTSLYVTGNLTCDGNTTVSCTALYVGKKLTIGGGSTAVTFGPTYVEGEGISPNSPAVEFGGNHHFDIPLLVTKGQIAFSGSQLVGTVDNPSLFLMIDDGDGVDENFNFGANGVFTGVLINMHGGFTLPGGNGTYSNGPPESGSPDIRGALFSKGSVTFGGNTKIVYDPDVIDNLDIGGTVPVTQIVPGTWQELPAN